MPGRQEGHVNRDQKWNHAAKITRGHSDAQKAGKPSRRPSLGPSGTHEPPAHATKEGLQQLQRDHFSNPTSWRQLDSSHLRNELDRAVKDLDIYMRIFSCNLTWINIHKSLKMRTILRDWGHIEKKNKYRASQKKLPLYVLLDISGTKQQNYKQFFSP